METGAVVQAWGQILSGYRPNLSIEITRECPLRCPGCYAYGDTHLGGDVVLRQLADFKGQELIDGVLDVVERHRPLHLSIVGGEPLVRFRELEMLLPKLTGMGVHVQVVTSAVRPIPETLGEHAAAAGVRVDRRPAAGARRAPRAGDLRSHSQAHQGPARHGALHDHAAAVARRVPHRVHEVLGAARRTSSASGSASTRRRRARTRRRCCAAKIASASSRRSRRLHASEPKLHDMIPTVVAGLPPPAAESGRVHLREDDGVSVVGSEADDHAVSVRRRSGLHAVRLPGVGRPRRAWPLPSSAASSRCGTIFDGSLAIGDGIAGAARRWRRKPAARRQRDPEPEPARVRVIALTAARP